MIRLSLGPRRRRKSPETRAAKPQGTEVAMAFFRKAGIARQPGRNFPDTHTAGLTLAVDGRAFILQA